MPECDMDKGLDELIELEPFAHQVGGHSAVLRYNDSTVCKGLVLRELQFYKTMPREMKQFTPQFRGVIEVSAHTDDHGYVTLVARPPTRFRRNSLTSSLPNLTNEAVTRSTIRASSLCPHGTIAGGEESGRASESEGKVEGEKDKGKEGLEDECFLEEEEEEEDKIVSDSESEQFTPRFRIHRTGSVEIEGLSRGIDSLGLEDGGDLEEGGRVFSSKHNMWSLRCHREHLAKISKGQPDQFFDKFLLLENLTCNYRLPCVLDLKMGTRQHGDDASEEKKLSQMNKCDLTTSSCLGVRICGMQVYQGNTGKYICHDKYFGRQLDEQGVRGSLHQFLHNGLRFHVELIQPIIARLRDLLSVLTNQETFRFYSSSLLIMYDAADWLIHDSPSADADSTIDAPLNQSGLSAYENSDWIVLDSPTDSSELDSRLGSNVRTTVSLSSNIKSNLSNVENSTVEKSSSCSDESKASVTQNDFSDCENAEKLDKQSVISVEKSFDNNEIPLPDSTKERTNVKTIRTAKINVRMIDFAHSTHYGFLDDKTPHIGPDHGYLFGIQSLIKLFEELLVA